MLRPRDQHGFAITTPCPLFREVLAGPLVLLLLLLLLQTSCLRTNRHIGLLDFKRRLPLDWISNTMNFIDSLTLLFLTLSAVKVSVSQRANWTKKKERKKHTNRPLFASCSHWSLMCSSSLPFLWLGHRSCLNKSNCLVALGIFKQPLRKANTVYTLPTHWWVVSFFSNAAYVMIF